MSTLSKVATPGNNDGNGWQRPLLATILPPCAASLSFFCNLALAQGAGRLIGVSCATPVLGPALGGLAVAAASAASAQISFSVRKMCTNGGKLDKLEPLSRESAVFYAVFGLVAFKVLGGRYRNVMPSNLIRPGALARSSIPSRGRNYANEVEAGLIKDLYKRYGCHHCGSTHGESIADHMPANLMAKRAMFKGFLRRLFPREKAIRQRLYPQCTSCMKLQSAALRHGKPSLVFHYHRGFPLPPTWTGFCIGALQLQDEQKPDP